MLVVENARVWFDTIALAGVDLTVAEGDVVAVLGPSGSGKSTLLRSIAGLQRLDAGTISWRGQPMDAVPVHRRPFGLMFQDHALFPHLDVARNVAFGLEMQGHDGIDARVAEVLDLVDLGGFQRRDVTELSGGEQQRVALARTLAPSPELLMLDEPVGSLDRRLREDLVAQLETIVRSLGITTVYVTHDQDESLEIADRIVIMRDGSIVQDGTPEDVWSTPADLFVARFLGLPNIIPGTVAGEVVETIFGPFPLGDPPTGDVSVLVPDHAIHFDDAGPLTGTVVRSRFRGGRRRVEIEVDGQLLTVERATFTAAEGDAVGVRIDARHVRVLANDPA